MKSLKINLSLILLMNISLLASQQLQWAQTFGSYQHTDIPINVVHDNQGNIYTTGDFVTTYNNCFGKYISKHDATGNLLWCIEITDNQSHINDEIRIAVDSNGNIYATGSFFGTIDFDPGPADYFLTSNGHKDIFISKFDTNANFLWAINVGGHDKDLSASITCDSNDNILITGTFMGNADFDPSNSNFILNSTNHDEDIFIAKYSSNGNFIWAKYISGISYFDVAKDITTDSNNNVYVTGTFQKIADFHPGQGTYNLNTGDIETGFVLKLDSNGDFVWAGKIGNGYCYPSAIAVDSLGKIFVTGHFFFTTDLDPDEQDSFFLTSNGWSDIFVVELSENGNFNYAFSLGGDGLDYANDIAVNRNNNKMYLTGSFQNTVDFDPYSQTHNLTSNGDADVYIVAYDLMSNYLWSYNFGTSSDDKGASIDTDENDNVYVFGNFSGFTDADPDPNHAVYLSTVDVDLFLLKLNGALGLSNNNSISYQYIYPNPNPGILKIKSEENAIANIFDESGKKLISIKLKKGINTIDISLFPNGNYFVKIESEKYSKYSKIILSK